MAVLAGIERAAAADLRVDFAELAQVMGKVLVEADMKLDNTPGFLGLGIGAGSSVTIGGATISIDLPARPTTFAGVEVVYHVSSLGSKSLTATARPGALRLTVTFEEDGPELIGDCLSGCSDSILPNIEWRRPVVSVDLVPVEVKGSIALQARRVEIGGDLSAVCRSNVGIISSGVCAALRPVANGAIRRLRADLPDSFRAKLNEPAAQEKMAAGLRRLLTLGPAGEVRVAKIAVDQKGIVVSFRF